MTLFDHPIYQYIAKYAHATYCGTIIRLDFLQLHPQLRELALGVVVNCISCGAVISPLRARAQSERSRIAGTAVEKRLFYAPTCHTDVNPGCSRSKVVSAHKEMLKQMFGGPK